MIQEEASAVSVVLSFSVVLVISVVSVVSEVSVASVVYGYMGQLIETPQI